jgi:hypothetical protein
MSTMDSPGRLQQTCTRDALTGSGIAATVVAGMRFPSHHRRDPAATPGSFAPVRPAAPWETPCLLPSLSRDPARPAAFPSGRRDCSYWC